MVNNFNAAERKKSAKIVDEFRNQHTRHDTGEWTNLGELKNYVGESFASLQSIIHKQTDLDWETVVTTKEFGSKTKAEAFGRIISHTAYHAGQMAVITKYY